MRGYSIGYDELYCKWYECTCCGGKRIAEHFKFCPDCGKPTTKKTKMKSIDNIINEKWEPVKLPWSEYPIGTKAKAVMGGHWIKVKLGWKWCTGATFPTPGGDAYAVSIPV